MFNHADEGLLWELELFNHFSVLCLCLSFFFFGQQHNRLDSAVLILLPNQITVIRCYLGLSHHQRLTAALTSVLSTQSSSFFQLSIIIEVVVFPLCLFPWGSYLGVDRGFLAQATADVSRELTERTSKPFSERS